MAPATPHAGVGIGALGIGIACAVVAAAIVISLAAGSRAAPVSHRGIGVAAPAAPAHQSGLNVGDFGTTLRAAVVAAPAEHTGLNVQDFGATPLGSRKILSQAPPQAIVVTAPAHISRELLVGDFAPPSEDETLVVPPQRSHRELLVDDFGN